MSKKRFQHYLLFSYCYFQLQPLRKMQLKKKAGFDLKNLDRSVSPAKDFYQFAAGGWVKNNPIPDDQTRDGVRSLF